MLTTDLPATLLPRPEEADVFAVFTECNDDKGQIIDFASARNFSWKIASGDYCCWIDSDDIFEAPGNDLDILRRECIPGKLVFYPYLQPDGSRHPLARIAKKSESFWKWPIHEGLTPTGAWRRVNGEGAIWRHGYGEDHHSEQVKRNLRICRYWENDIHWKDDARFAFLMAEATRAAGEWEEAREHYRRSYDLFSPHNEYRFLIAWEMIGYDRMENSEQWANALIEVKPEWPNGYFTKARFLWNVVCDGKNGTEEARVQAREAIDLIQTGLSFPRSEFMIRDYGDKDNFEIYKTLSLAQTFVGDIEGAIATCENALLLREDGGFRNNLEVYREFLSKRPSLR
jgi:glycosyltransferase involved in cell wall biosynthesis